MLVGHDGFAMAIPPAPVPGGAVLGGPPGFPFGAADVYAGGCGGFCPAAAAAACTLHRSSTTPVALLANTAMLDEPLPSGLRT